MPRPQCHRRISHNAPTDYFKPAGVPLCDLEEVLLGADELEVVRLANLEGHYHTAAAKEMGISRQTFVEPEVIVGRLDTFASNSRE